MIEEASSGGICVECGAAVAALYSALGDGAVLRLERCGQCHCVADRYIEVDSTLLLIDIVLHRAQAYRHLLFNRNSIPSARLLALLILAVNYFIQLSAVKRNVINASVDLLWLQVACLVLLEHFVFVSSILAGLRLLPGGRAVLASQRLSTLYVSVVFSEAGKVVAVLDCEPALLLVLGTLVLSLQHTALHSACMTLSARRLYLVLAIATIMRASLRLVLNTHLSVWWSLL